MDTLLAIGIGLLVPPVTFAITALAGLIAMRRWRRAGLAAAWCSLVLLLLLGTPAVSETLLWSLEATLPRAAAAGPPPQAIVVLGGDMSRSLPPGRTEDVGDLSLDRVRAAAALERRTGLPVLITGGPLRRTAAPISVLMARTMVDDFGLPTPWTEERSEDTWQNAFLSAAALRSRGIGNVLLVTQPWHMKRALLAFARAGLTATPAPTQYLRIPDFGELSAWVPSARSWADSYFALHEWIGTLYYEARG